MKRIELNTVSTSQKQRKVARKQQTYRFNVLLLDPTSETCPEYSFLDLVKKQKRGDVGDPYEEADDQSEVVAISQRFEAKYGPKGLQSGKKKRTQEMDDFYDPGGGYDEDDPFIDNTEAYDEVIPAALTNQYGGFCINRGRLDFKDLNDDPWDRLKAVNKKKKVRVLESESEGESGITLAKKLKAQKRKKRLESKELEGKTRLSNSEEGGQVRRKSKLKLKKPAADPPHQKGGINLPVPSSIPTSSAPTPSMNSAAVNKGASEAVINGTADVKKEVVVKDEFSALEETSKVVLGEALNEDSSSKSGEQLKGENQSAERNTPLPSQLPPKLLEAIENMKQEAKETKEKKFFTAYINKLLLDIELGSHKLPWGSKTAIYSHLSEHLPYGKYTLQRRAKKLRESQEKDQLKGPILLLREAIGKVMPALEQQHEKNVQKAKMDAEAQDDIADVVKEEVSTESEGEEKCENRKKLRGPRRKFQWNPEIRDLLLGIVSTKMKHFSSGKTRSQTAEEYLKAYLDSDIKPHWPHGWMQTRMLFKESRKAHGDLTKGLLQGGKQKKVTASSDTAPTASETPRVPRTEDVIEVSSFVENPDKNKKTVVINLPNSVASMTQVYHPLLSSASVASGDFKKESFKISLAAGQGAQVSLSSDRQQRTVVSGSLSGKGVVAVSLPDSPRMSYVHKDDGVKSLNPVSCHGDVVTSGGQGFSLALPSTTYSSTTRLKTETLDELNNNGTAKLDPSSFSTHQQQQKFRTINPQTVTSQKGISSQQETGKVKHGQFLPEKGPTTTSSQQYKTAARSSPKMTATKDASWSNASSAVPHNKLSSAFLDKTTDNKIHKMSTGFKNSSTALRQNPILPPNQHELTMAAKSNPITVQKKQPSLNATVSSSNSSAFSEAQSVSRVGTLPGSTFISSKDDSRKSQKSAHYQDFAQKSGHLSPQLKTVMGMPNFGQKFGSSQPQNIKTGTVITPSAALQLSSRTAADFTAWTSNKLGNLKQPSSPRKTLPSTTNNARSSPVVVSSLVNKQPGVFNNNLSVTAPSQKLTPVPQMSSLPLSELASLSPYEQIKTYMQQQETFEDQALKNLAMAAQLEGKSHSAIFDANSSRHLPGPHKNIFTQMNRSIPDHLLSAHSAKIRPSSSVLLSTQAISRNTNFTSLSESSSLLKQAVKTPSTALLQKSKPHYSNSLLTKTETVRQVNALNLTLGQDSYLAYPPFKKTSNHLKPSVINDCEGMQPQRSRSIIEIPQLQEQDGNHKNGKKTDAS